jgi:putative flippase GtrA
MLKIEPGAWWRLPQQLRFLVAGAYNTVFGYAAFALLFWAFGHRVHYLVIGVAANVIAVCSAFVVHRTCVFRSQENWRGSFLRFYLSQLVTLAFGIAALFLLVEFMRMNPLIAQLLIISGSVVLSYGLHRYYTFRERLGSSAR